MLAEAGEYGDAVGAAYLAIAQCSVSEPPRPGAEIFSLMRDGELQPSDYLDRFFDTGRERQH